MMFSRVHISSFVGLTALAWIVALWIQGQAVLSWEFLRPFGMVVSAIVLLSASFNRWAWSWKLFRGWYVNRPDLRGTWRATLESDWIDPETGMTVAPIEGYVVIRQTLSTLSARLVTAESLSKSITYGLTSEADEVFRLAVVYRNEPKIDLQGDRSEIHHGSFLVEVPEDVPRELHGHYWTDRKTRGAMHCTDRIRQYCNTFPEAIKAYGAKSVVQQNGALASQDD